MVKSNKLFKILVIMLVAICLVTAFSGVVNAVGKGTPAKKDTPEGSDGGIVGTYTDVSPEAPDDSASTKITTTTGKVLGIIQAAGIVAGVVIIAYMGVKYITSSPDGKAEIKKQAAIYVLGAAFLMLAPTIAKAIFNAIG